MGPVVCSCFGVGRNAIRAAIAAGATSVDEIGCRVRAGTNCGSCKPEMGRLLARSRASPSASAVSPLRPPVRRPSSTFSLP
ncbi:MAG: (2Fe-2S)-binding protein [Roseiarcus sp.]